MEKYFAIQWQNPETLGWETCENFDHNDSKVPTLYMEQEEAHVELQEWRDTGDTYRMIEVTLKEIV